MPKSKRFLELEDRLDVLRQHFLPVTFSPTGAYDPVSLDHARAFILLAHAEIESYLEDRALSKADRARRRWKSRGLCSALLSRLLVYHSARSRADGWSPSLPSNDAVQKAINFYQSELGRNNGIKEKNILCIFLPIGFRHCNLNATLLATLNSFGESRGKLAHLSVKAHQPIDPKSVSDEVWKNILPDLEKLDESLNKLR
jgi:hypothetical protein